MAIVILNSGKKLHSIEKRHKILTEFNNEKFNFITLFWVWELDRGKRKYYEAVMINKKKVTEIQE